MTMPIPMPSSLILTDILMQQVKFLLELPQNLLILLMQMLQLIQLLLILLKRPSILCGMFYQRFVLILELLILSFELAKGLLTLALRCLAVFLVFDLIEVVLFVEEILDGFVFAP